MKTWIMKARNAVQRHLAMSMIALVTLGVLASYETIRPLTAKAAMPPAAAPLDDASISPLLSLDRAMETLAARVTPAIVNISVTSKAKPEAAEGEMPEELPRGFGEFFGQRMVPHAFDQPQIQHVGGSGVIISPSGYIVTNQHVVDGAVEIRVTLSDRRILPAKLVGSDPLTDLAVLKVEGKDLPSVPWGNSADLHPGQTVLAFGNPFNFRFTVTRGIVSALNRPNPYSDDPRKPGGFIQTDAAINQGNSGGPLVDVRGEVVGINTFLISPSGAFSGMGFAIPSQIAQPTVETLIRDGKVTHAYMGVGISDVTPENAKFFQSDANGAVITQVEPDSPAAKSGLKVGDVITGFEGRKVSDATELQVAVGGKRPGTTVKLGLLRDGKAMTLPVTLEAMGSHQKGTNEVGENGHGKMRWGLGLADLTPELRDQLDMPKNLQGAVVEGVEPGSPADDAGLRKGDVITQVNRKNVDSASEIQQAFARVPKGEDALVLVWSNGGSTFRVLHAPGA